MITPNCGGTFVPANSSDNNDANRTESLHNNGSAQADGHVDGNTDESTRPEEFHPLVWRCSPGGDFGPRPGAGEEKSDSIASCLPGHWRDLCQFCEARAGIPADLVALAMLGAQSGISVGHFVGTTAADPIPACLHLLVEAPSGSGKSRAHHVAIQPLHRIEEQTVEVARQHRLESVRPQELQLEARIRNLKWLLGCMPGYSDLACEIARLEDELRTVSKFTEESQRFLLDDATSQGRDQLISRADRNAIFLATPDGRPQIEALLSSKGKALQLESNAYLRGYSGDPLVANRVTKGLERRAPSAWMSVWLGIQTDLASNFLSSRNLRENGVLGRFLAFSVGRAVTTGQFLDDADLIAAAKPWHDHLVSFAAWRWKHRGDPPMGMSYARGAMAYLRQVRHPFETVDVSTGSLRHCLLLRWQEQVMRVALVLALMDLPDEWMVLERHTDAAFHIVVRAHSDTMGLASNDDRTQDEIDRDELVRHLRKAGFVHMVSVNASGFPLERLRQLAAAYPETFEETRMRTGAPGQPPKILRLRNT